MYQFTVTAETIEEINHQLLALSRLAKSIIAQDPLGPVALGDEVPKTNVLPEESVREPATKAPTVEETPAKIVAKHIKNQNVKDSKAFLKDSNLVDDMNIALKEVRAIHGFHTALGLMNKYKAKKPSLINPKLHSKFLKECEHVAAQPPKQG